MSLVFWFDVHSPWCYLAAHRIGDLARKHGEELTWKPIHLPRLLERIDGRKPLEANPAFVRWFKQDIADWAEVHGLPIAQHPEYPLRNSRALRACQFAADEGKGEALAKRILRAYWAGQGDIADLDSIGSWAEECGLDANAVRAAAVSPEFKRRIDENTEAAIARGVFGVPTADTGAKLYFGNDRLTLLDWHLSGKPRPVRDSL